MPAEVKRTEMMEGSIEYFGRVPESLTRVYWVGEIDDANVSTQGSGAWFGRVMDVLPPMLEPDPQYAFMLLGGYKIQPLGPFDAKAYLTYYSIGLRRYSFSGGLSTVYTNFDRTGATVFVDCEGSADRPIATHEQRQSGVMTLNRPMETLTVSFYAAHNGASPYTHPRYWSHFYLGKLNSAEIAFPSAPAGTAYAIHTLMCESVTSEIVTPSAMTTETEFVYRISLGLRWNPRTWDPEVVYIDRRTGEPHVDIVPNVGRRIVTTAYEEADFSYIFA